MSTSPHSINLLDSIRCIFNFITGLLQIHTKSSKHLPMHINLKQKQLSNPIPPCGVSLYQRKTIREEVILTTQPYMDCQDCVYSHQILIIHCNCMIRINSSDQYSRTHMSMMRLQSSILHSTVSINQQCLNWNLITS